LQAEVTASREADQELRKMLRRAKDDEGDLRKKLELVDRERHDLRVKLNKAELERLTLSKQVRAPFLLNATIEMILQSIGVAVLLAGCCVGCRDR
jgi:hypothetical protein